METSVCTRSKPLARRASAANRPGNIIPSALIFPTLTTGAISPTAKEGVLRPVSTPEQAAACLEQVRSEPDAAPASANQTVLAEHYQAVIHTNDFYEYLKLYRELAHKQSTQRSKGRKVNAMDAYFYQMAERTLREELAVAFHETPEAAARRLEAAVS